MEIGICFDTIHSYDDLGLILTSAELPPPAPRTKYIEIPGADGLLDASEENGEIRYETRNWKLNFAISPKDMTIEEKKAEISNALNGKIMKITLDMDREYYYLGRVTVDSYVQKGNLLKVVISAKVDPYKLKQNATTVIAKIDVEDTVICENIRKTVIPVITTDAEMTLKFGNINKTVKPGEHQFADFLFKAGANRVTCKGTGTIMFTYREGSL